MSTLAVSGTQLQSVRMVSGLILTSHSYNLYFYCLEIKKKCYRKQSLLFILTFNIVAMDPLRGSFIVYSIIFFLKGLVHPKVNIQNTNEDI